MTHTRWTGLARLWVVCMLALPFATACSDSGGGSPGNEPSRTPTAASSPSSSVGTPSIRVERSFQLDEPVAHLVAHKSIVWASSDIRSRGGYLLRLVDGTRAARTTIGIVPNSIAYGHGSMWVANGNGRGVVYNPTTGEGPGFPGEDSVQRVDPVTGRVVASLRVPDPFDLAVSQSDVWVMGQEQSTVLRSVDPQTNTVGRAIRLQGHPLAVRATDSVVWALTSGGQLGGRLYKIDAAEKRILGVTPVPAFSTSDLVVGESRLWILLTGVDGGLVPVDPSSGRPTGQRVCFSYPETVQASGDMLWLTSSDQDGSQRIQVLDGRSGEVIADAPNEYGAHIRAVSGGTAWGVSETGRRVVAFGMG